MNVSTDRPTTTPNGIAHHRARTACRIGALLTAGVLTAGLGLATAATAGAAAAGSTGLGSGTAAPTSPSRTERTRDLSVEKARCTAAVDSRLAELTKLQAALDAAGHLTDAHHVAQAAALTDASSGLGALRATIAADTDAAALKDHCQAIVEDYRVFALRSPQTHLIRVGDQESYAIDRLNETVPKLAGAIDAAEAAGQDMTAARAALADLDRQLAEATARSSGVADAVIAFGPAEYNADHTVLEGPRADLGAAAAALDAAGADLKIITAGLGR